MKIDKLIDRHYYTASILEDTREIKKWLKVLQYLAVMDEELQIIGVITSNNLRNPEHYQVIDCDFRKPSISPDQTVLEAMELMKAAKTNCLPVYEGGIFIGVLAFPLFWNG